MGPRLLCLLLGLGRRRASWESEDGQASRMEPLGHSHRLGLLTPWRECQVLTDAGAACLFVRKGQDGELVGGLLAKRSLQDCSWPPPGDLGHEDRLPLQPPARRHGSGPTALGASPALNLGPRRLPTAHLTA